MPWSTENDEELTKHNSTTEGSCWPWSRKNDEESTKHNSTTEGSWWPWSTESSWLLCHDGRQEEPTKHNSTIGDSWRPWWWSRERDRERECMIIMAWWMLWRSYYCRHNSTGPWRLWSTVESTWLSCHDGRHEEPTKCNSTIGVSWWPWSRESAWLSCHDGCYLESTKHNLTIGVSW